MNYINFLVNRNSLLDYNQNYYTTYADPYTPLPIEEPETEWKLEISHERTVQDSSGLDGIPKEDVGEVQEHSLRARPIGGPVLKRTREFDSKYQHTGTKIEVRSPLLVEALREAITAEQHSEFVTLHYDPVVFREPYMLLFHYWNDIVSLRDASDGDKEKQLEFLLSSLEHECPTIARVAKDLASNSIKTIVFEALWLLYRPGTTVFSRSEGPLRAYIVESVSGGTKLAKGSFAPLKLSLRSSTAAAAGKGCMQTYSTGVVDAFAAEAKIEGLIYVPAGFLPNEEEERRKLIDRGTIYVKLMEKPQVMEYKGNEWKKTWEEDTARVVIDVSMETAPPRARDEANHNPTEPYGAYRQPYALPGCNCSLCTGRDNQHRLGTHISGCTCAACISSSVSQSSTWDATGVYLYLPHDIYAFSLVRKSWRSVAIDDLVPPFFEETMMSKKLVIDKDHREIVTSLVSSYTSGNLRFSDFVKGKGRGLVILLHGSPGTGKTLTAECVAEQARRPLYAITCGDLGVESNKLESELRNIFDRATKWNAVLLLDEADVFLQERDVRNLERNALVSVFLRELEYFDGILFLTTNRPGQLDEAFQSRIHITLAMASLDVKAQLKVWKTFLADVVPEESDLRKCLMQIKKATMESPLNGRQIRNCVRSALSLAAQNNNPVSFEHIQKVLELTKTFSKYMKDLHGQTGDERGSFLGYRGK